MRWTVAGKLRSPGVRSVGKADFDFIAVLEMLAGGFAGLFATRFRPLQEHSAFADVEHSATSRARSVLNQHYV